MTSHEDAGARLLAAALLALLALLLFLPAVRHPFSMYDDPVYVTENAVVLEGLGLRGIGWAFTSGEGSNWHPVTWLSHMLDVELFGLRPGAHHVVNVLLHAVNVALVFWLLAGATGRRGASAAVAALFAVHPLRVESVAWVAERKDVLSTLFALATLIAYVRYASTPAVEPRATRVRRYVAVVAFFALALMSKPMTVTLPVLMLALDAWPLGRLPGAGTRGGAEAARSSGAIWRSGTIWPLLREKLPLFALSAAASAVTIAVQGQGGALDYLGPVPMLVRLQNAVVSYGAYLAKTVWPANLAVLYPYRDGGPGGPALVASLAALVAITAVAVRTFRTRPYVAAGWGWFVVALLPVSGLIQAGAQSMADRYTYLAHVGLFVPLVWGAAELTRRARTAGSGAAVGPGATGKGGVTGSAGAVAAAIVAVAAVGAVTALAVTTFVQLGHWRSDVALFGHAVRVTRNNFIAHNNLGIALAREGRFAEAVEHHAAAIAIRPDWSEVYKFHAAAAFDLMQLGRFDEAEAAYREVLRHEPTHLTALNDIGVILARRGDRTGALRHFEAAVARVPAEPRLRVNLAIALEGHGRRAEAAAQLREALRLQPDDGQAREMLARLGG